MSDGVRATPEPAVVCHGLVRRFGDVVAVDELSLSVERGTVFGLLGHNGAGKTTTIRLLNGVLAADAGEVRVLGFDPGSEGSTLRERTGVLGETPGLDERLTGRENLRLLLAIRGIRGPSAEAAIDAEMARFGLQARADDRVSTYSRGMRQRLALVLALLHRPELLFLDEPTMGLDPVAAADVRALVRRLAEEERTIVLCTHDLELAQRVCDRVAVIERGRLLAEGAPSDLGGRAGIGTNVEIEVGVAAVVEAIAALDGFGHVEAGPAGVVRLNGTTRESVPAAVAALVARGVPVYRVDVGVAELEAAYLALASRVEPA